MKKNINNYASTFWVWGVLRLFMGWTFFWAFIDKLFGLGFATAPDKAWLAGGSPTTGFLRFATKGPFAELFQGLAGSAVIDWLFMVALAFIGVSLLLGIFVRMASVLGIALMITMYIAGFIWPEHNPFLDEHIINTFILIGVAVSGSGAWFGLGARWAQTRLVKKFPFLT